MSKGKSVVPHDYYPELLETRDVPMSREFDIDDSVHLLDYWHVARNRRWTLLAVLSTIVTITMIYTFRQVPIYSATVTIQIDREDSDVLSFQEIYRPELGADDSLQTQFQVLQSRSLAKRVVDDLNLEREEEFQPREPSLVSQYVQELRNLFSRPSEFEEASSDSDPLRGMIDSYVGRIDVAPVRLTRLVEVSFEAEDPELATRVINAHARHFIEQNFLFKFEATQEASAFLSDQLVGLQADLEEAEEGLQEFGSDNQILFYDVDGRSTFMQMLVQLESEHIRAQADRFQKESYNRLIESGNTDALPQLMASPSLIPKLTTDLGTLRQQESQLAVTFAPEYPGRKRLRVQIEELSGAIEVERDRIVKTIQAEYEASIERELLLAAAIAEQRDAVIKVNGETIHYNILKREVDTNKFIYEGVLMRLKEAGVSAGLRASHIRVVDPAEVPRGSVRPRKRLSLILSMAVGLTMGLGLVFLQEYLDNTIKSVEDVDTRLRLPSLGAIPRLGSASAGKYRSYEYGSSHRLLTAKLATGKQRVDRIVHDAPTSYMAEAFRALRTSLLLSSADRQMRVIVVSSAVPNEGKTITSINTAISLTQTGARVALIDADMRKPRIGSIFSIEGSPGLSAFLSGGASLKEILSESSIPNLHIIPSGISPPNPGELVMSNRYREMTRLLSEYFDYVIIDSPPLMNVSDGRVLASIADGVVLVVRANSTSVQHVNSAVDGLEQANAHIVGVVLNDLDLRKTSGGRYYSGHNYYSSGYSEIAAP